MRASRRWTIKRILDLALTVPLLFLLAPVMGLVALLVRLKLGPPVLFRQIRAGRNAKPFVAYKFRTMTEETDKSGALLPDDRRLTPLGRVLRALSLDELPELLNVLRGEMSLVGPRPLLMRYNPYFTDEERIRFTVLPGITGLAQVSGRNTLSWDERIAADVRYVREWSIWLDLKILGLTLFRVLTRHGLHVDPAAAMPDFDEERRRRLGEKCPIVGISGETMAC